MTTDNKAKHLSLLKIMYDPKSGKQELESVKKAQLEMSETEQVQFDDFQYKVGNVFLQLKDDLDKGLEELADEFPDETDPRKWESGDWFDFYTAVLGHQYEALYTTYAKQEPNLHLMWEEIEKRL